MGIRLEGEQGNVIELSSINFAAVIDYLWNEHIIQSYPWLKGIDPYGTTLFNLHQVPNVIHELEELSATIKDEKLKSIIQGTIEFVNKVEQHIYIRFIGD